MRLPAGWMCRNPYSLRRVASSLFSADRYFALQAPKFLNHTVCALPENDPQGPALYQSTRRVFLKLSSEIRQFLRARLHQAEATGLSGKQPDQPAQMPFATASRPPPL